jgi:dihydrofolate reductase
LTERVNAVITKNEEFDEADCLVFPSVESALQYFDDKEDRDVYIIGGGQIYKYCLELDVVEEMFITEVKEEFEADTFFPELQEDNWNKELLMEWKADEKNRYDFDIYLYKRKR